MRELNEHHSFMGMQKDLVCSKHPVNFLYDARNIRLTSRGDSTMLAITNEQGTKFATDVRGVYVGHACISKYLVLFTSSEGGSTDMIIRIDLTNLDKKILYTGRLNFSEEYPITTLPFFENEEIQKVYWVDGLNQPRLINVMKEAKENIDTQFDFIRELALKEKVYITKNATGGYFPSGVIQYAFTYVSKYMQESNIFYISPLFYISPEKRGAAPDESVSNSFTFKVSNVDLNFDFIRVYSIQRTSIDGTAIVKRVKDIAYKATYTDDTTIVQPTWSLNGGGTVNEQRTYDAVLLYKAYNEDLIIETNDGKYITWGNSSDSNWIRLSGLSTSYMGMNIKLQSSEPVAITDFNPYNGLSSTDTGNIGDVVDPTELLYKGNNSVVANCLTQKDNTLFLGGLKLESSTLIDTKLKAQIRNNVLVTADTEIAYTNSGTSHAEHRDYLFARRNSHTGVSYSGFKHYETYRLGFQLQYKNGAWTDPIYKGDYVETKRPTYYSNTVSIDIPTFKGTLQSRVVDNLIASGFRKIRAVVVYPKFNERTVLFQCVSSPTTKSDNNIVQSSWYFRHYGPLDPAYNNPEYLKYLHIPTLYIRQFMPFSAPTGATEVECYMENPFSIDTVIQTLHSPDVEFDDTVAQVYNNVKCTYVGRALLYNNNSAVNIQTSSGTINPNASGPLNGKYIHSNGQGEGYGKYSDYIVDDSGDGGLESFSLLDKPFHFPVYLWNKSGSLNNDITRESGKGAQSAVLKKKVFSNRRFYDTKYLSQTDSGLSGNYVYNSATLHLFNSDQLSVVKLNNNITYQGNVDTVLAPKEGTGKYCYDGSSWYYLSNTDANNNSGHGVWKLRTTGDYWDNIRGEVGDSYPGLVRNRNTVRMKYKSTAHLVGSLKKWFWVSGDTLDQLPIIDVINTTVNSSTKFGGSTEKALLENQWLPCGEPVLLEKGKTTTFRYSYGDTYFGMWDCLKTYAFTPEDENQCVEIGCFQLESRVNPCGRYDRNRDQVDNTMMSPVNFNLMNMVYSQKDNFFTYRILDEDYYKNSNYPNQVTWSKEKQAATDVDLWTNITLTSTYDMDGTKGKINCMTTFKDQIFIFQDRAISNLLFNSRVQIPTSDGTPIEITNNYKVEGHRTLSDGVGCSNKDLVKQTPNNIYFIDSISNHLFTISDSLQDLSATHYMTSWFNGTSIDKLMYDSINHDLYVVNGNGALCFSELLGQFVSFYDYDHIKLIETYDSRVFTLRQGRTPDEQFLWYMFEGHYNSFFEYEYEVAPGIILNTGSHKSWYLTFISNGTDAQTVDFDKIFTNIDYRMDFTDNELHSPNLTFDYMQVTDEYQNTGIVEVKRLKYQNLPNSFHHKEANTQKKFRIWRIQIPRALTWKTDRITGERKEVQSNDRIRNPWCKITLGNYGKDNTKALLHDINVQYYI